MGVPLSDANKFRLSEGNLLTGYCGLLFFTSLELSIELSMQKMAGHSQVWFLSVNN